MNRQGRWNNGLLVLGVLALGIVPLLAMRDAEFSGADSQVNNLIQQENPDYQTWAEPVLKPASPEIESLLFALQAGAGAGIIGYVIGLHRGRHERNSIPNSKIGQNHSESKDH